MRTYLVYDGENIDKYTVEGHKVRFDYPSNGLFSEIEFSDNDMSATYRYKDASGEGVIELPSALVTSIRELIAVYSEHNNHAFLDSFDIFKPCKPEV